MRFDDPPQSEDEPIRPESIVPPADKMSKVIRMRLVMLVGMLFLVGYLMNEAGKPERWEWMGFDKQNRQPDDADVAAVFDEGTSDKSITPTIKPSETQVQESKNQDPKRSNPTSRSDPRSNSPGPAFSVAGESANSSSRSAPLGSPDDGMASIDYPVAAQRFWRDTFSKLNFNKTLFLRILKHVRNGQSVDPAQQAAAQQLVKRLAERRDFFQQDLFDGLALSSDGTETKKRLSEEMSAAQDIWDNQILPAITASSHGEEFTISQLKAAERLQAAIDPILYAQVQDATKIGWTGDSATWKRIWEKICISPMPESTAITRVELMGQPKLYRGRAVEVEGWVRGGRKESLGTNSELGIPHYYVLWVRPRETKLGTYCIYTRTLPEGFPELTDKLTEINEQVRVRGYFFKIRNYIAQESVLTCPLIASPAVELIETKQFTAIADWQPSRITLTVILVMLPIFATGIAWSVFRSSKTRPFVHGNKMQSRIDQSLYDLSDDPQVQTEQERVMALYESDELDD